jgi:hypothetical protein
LEIAKNADLIIQPVGASNDDLIPAVKEFNAYGNLEVQERYGPCTWNNPNCRCSADELERQMLEMMRIQQIQQEEKRRQREMLEKRM